MRIRGEASASVRAGGARLRQGYGGSAVARARSERAKAEGPSASEGCASAGDRAQQPCSSVHNHDRHSLNHEVTRDTKKDLYRSIDGLLEVDLLILD